MEKSEFNEETDEWVLPFVKQRDVSSMFPSLVQEQALPNLNHPLSSEKASKKDTTHSPRPSILGTLPQAVPLKVGGPSSPRGALESPHQRRKKKADGVDFDTNEDESILLPLTLVPKPPKSRAKKRNKKKKEKVVRSLPPPSLSIPFP